MNKFVSGSFRPAAVPAGPRPWRRARAEHQRALGNNFPRSFQIRLCLFAPQHCRNAGQQRFAGQSLARPGHILTAIGRRHGLALQASSSGFVSRQQPHDV